MLKYFHLRTPQVVFGTVILLFSVNFFLVIASIASNGCIKTNKKCRERNSRNLSFLQLPRGRCSFVQTHGWTLIHAHVSITEQSSCTTLNFSGIQWVQFFHRHLQVFANFWAWGDLWNVKAILTSFYAWGKRQMRIRIPSTYIYPL